jgi:hypothetical protein
VENVGVSVGNVSNTKCVVIMHVCVNTITYVMMWISGFKRKIFTPAVRVQMFLWKPALLPPRI